jgi:uncharacterized membrane protein YgaE (UPF0421/DUF939 family)
MRSQIHVLLVSAKAALSAVLAVYVCQPFHLHAVAWAAISAVLVTQPKLHPSFRASMLRFVANIIGALIGFLLYSFLGHTILAMAIGIFVTGIACHFTRMEEVSRPAFAAVVIVVLSGSAIPGSRPIDRVVAVLVGCASALLVGFLFDKLTRLLLPVPEQALSYTSHPTD